MELVTDSGETVSCDWAHYLFITAHEYINQEKNQCLDMILVAQNLSNPRADVQVNVLDLGLVLKQVAASPSLVDSYLHLKMLL